MMIPMRKYLLLLEWRVKSLAEHLIVLVFGGCLEDGLVDARRGEIRDDCAIWGHGKIKNLKLVRLTLLYLLLNDIELEYIFDYLGV